MLRYTVKPSKFVGLMDFPINELFVSQDLSYISGTTDASVGLVNGEEVIIKSPYLIGNEINTINVETVKRQGVVEVNIELPVKRITSPLNFPIYSDENSNSYIVAFNKNVEVDSEGGFIVSSVTQNYVEYNGDISYFFDGSTKGYLVDHKFYYADKNDDTLTITTYLFIENGKLVVGDYKYYADFSKENQAPELRLNKEHEPITTNNVIGLIDGCKCIFKSIKDYEPSKWKKINKFVLNKAFNPVLNVDDVLCGGYKHYVIFNDENYYLRNIYQTDENSGDEVYLGYGVIIEGTFYAPSINYGIEQLYEQHHDLPYGGNFIYVGKYDEYLEIHDSLISQHNDGNFVIIINSNNGGDIIPGNFIIAESNLPIEFVRPIQTDEDVVIYDGIEHYGNEYIEFEGKKYLVEAKLCDTINISGKDYLLDYLKFDEDGKPISASTIINGETMYFDVTGTTAKLTDEIYYKDPNSTQTTIKVKYGKNENLYSITENSGVTINGNKYAVLDESEVSSEEIENPYRYVIVNENIKITLRVMDINGSSTYLAYPVIDENNIDEIYEDELRREYCNILSTNWKNFNFVIRKDTFGNKPLTVENGLMESMSSTLPYTISNNYLLENNISIFRTQNYLSFKFPLVNKPANNLRREDIIKNDFVDYIRNEAINTYVDMEKDVYYPVWKDEDDSLKPIQQIRFNLHFRTRNFDNWKIYEDDREFKNVNTINSVKSNWFITDLNYYKELSSAGRSVLKNIHNSSDLLGLMNFTTEEIRNQSEKIGKSFLRLSFYSTNDPKTQVLLATSTIFLDENRAYKKYMNSKRNSDLKFIDTKIMQQAGYNTLSEYISAVSSGKDKLQVSSNTISDSSEVYTDLFLNDDTRLSSRFIVNDKYNSDTSSEGYYIYIFKDYAKKLRETTIYMKVDFNHAGIGKTISFILPRRIDDGNVDGVGTPFYLHKEDDIAELKDGFKLTDIYKQTYIPIRVIYDEKTNKYVYYLPDELRENTELGVKNEIMEFNLFEIKFANESVES